jgi:hypothetical protein
MLCHIRLTFTALLWRRNRLVFGRSIFLPYCTGEDVDATYNNCYLFLHIPMRGLRLLFPETKKGKAIPVQAVEAHRAVRRRGSHIF